MNVWKNSSLAIIVAYSDIFYVIFVMMNNLGKLIPLFLLLLVTYQAGSLLISGIMNYYNSKSYKGENMIPEDSTMDKIARRESEKNEIFASKLYDFDLFAKNLLKVERSFAGRSRWDQNYEKDIQLSILCLSLSLLFSFYMIDNTISSIDLVGEITSTDRLLFSIEFRSMVYGRMDGYNIIYQKIKDCMARI